MSRIRKKIDIGLVVDCSGSLERYKSDIEDAIRGTIYAIKTSDELFGCEIYFSLIPFAEKIDKSRSIKFKAMEQVTSKDVKLVFEGQTNPGEALKEIMIETTGRYQHWKDNGMECYHPLIFFFTDGYPYPQERYQSLYEDVARMIKAEEANKQLLIVGAGFGSVDIENMKKLTSHPVRILKIEGSDISKVTDFFKDLIPMTIVHTVTGAIDAIDRMFADF